MTTPELPAGRPIPDTDDLRLLAELINNISIPLANAAWNARMSQTEAALRLLSMADRGLPMRLLADGDRQALWHIAQAGPATSGVPATGGAPPAHSGSEAGPPPSGDGPATGSGPTIQAGQQVQPGAVAATGGLDANQAASAPPTVLPPEAAPAAHSGPGPIAPPMPAGSGPVVLPPTAAVPPHEQAIAGAVPLGRPPFGPGGAPTAADPEQAGPETISDPEHAGPPATADPEHPGPGAMVPDAVAESEPANSMWGPPVTSSWTRAQGDSPSTVTSPEEDAGDNADGLAAGTPAEVPAAATGTPEGATASDNAGTVVEPPPTAEPTPPRRPIWQSQPVAGPTGEQLQVRILDVLDPGDEVLTGAGYRMEAGQRAVLVHSGVTNVGATPYYPVGDLNLVLETDQRMLLGRKNIAVASHPAFPVGVASGQTTQGWSVFLIPSDVALAGIKWCIRPDIPQTILSWPIAP